MPRPNPRSSELNSIVLDALKTHQVGEDDRVLIPTGDGMCIALLSAQLPYDIHIKLALAILAHVYGYNQATKVTSRQFQVRIGINQNTDIIVTDVNGRTNVAGAGVNLASRVMDKSDGNQILVSQTVYDELQPSEAYMDKFRAFDTQSKHRVAFRVYQYLASNKLGLDCNVPTEFVPKKASEPKLSKEAATYFAHAFKNRAFILSKQGRGQTNYNLTLMLWFLAEDSVGESEASVIDPYEKQIYGKGQLSLDEILKYYDRQDFDIVAELANSIATSLKNTVIVGRAGLASCRYLLQPKA